MIASKFVADARLKPQKVPGTIDCLKMMAYIPSPARCQCVGEDLTIEMRAIISPGFIERTPGANGLFEEWCRVLQ